MPSAAYFRRQADICLRLSLIASDDEVSNRLVAMARDYMATGDALEKSAGGSESGAPDPSEARPSGAAPELAPDNPGGPTDC